ncbi:DUF5949 family protein [Streptomyces fuscigenes]|uniref:DUF5949 family protein n=1 Tax=Streptomyces fuscigenes TaxID=1528880 RepID=UPI001F42FC26|nr:DUF5949 family protein [Streptomyces fuscigenes]MCF3964283.1 DUF5949 family protein [Streptomyces fuscigenes]
MTTSNTASYAPLMGTLSVIPWTSDPAEGERNAPFLLAYSLGDGREGPEAGEQTLGTVLGEIGLTPGDEVVDLAGKPSVAITLLVEAGRAVLTMPYLNAQCPVPPEWEEDARRVGQVYFIVATKPWTSGVPGRPVTEEQLRDFIGDEEVLATAVHCLLPVRSLTG